MFPIARLLVHFWMGIAGLTELISNINVDFIFLMYEVFPL